jgi:hypothetical protein
MKDWRKNWELKLTAVLLAVFLWLALRLNHPSSPPVLWPASAGEAR